MNGYFSSVISCLKSRIAWYEKAIALSIGEIPWENHFDFPTSTLDRSNAASVWEWRGAVREMKNTLDMLEHAARQ